MGDRTFSMASALMPMLVMSDDTKPIDPPIRGVLNMDSQA